MEIAIIVVFLAIFGGAAFLALLIWFVFRRRNSDSQSQNHSTYPNQTVYNNSSGTDETETDFDNSSNLNYKIVSSAGNENATAYDSPNQNESVNAQVEQSSYSAPADYGSVESSSSSYDSGGSSSDSGSSSSDSGSSSSSD